MLINDLRALIVRIGNVATVPEPPLELLLGISLIGLIGAVSAYTEKKAVDKS